MFVTCFRRDPSNLKVLAQLISAYSLFDARKAEEMSRKLPSPDDMGNGECEARPPHRAARALMALVVRFV